MGYEYVSVDSMNRRAHERTSRILVQLSEPIQHATSVEVVSFSTANEFFNVFEGYNTMHFEVYSPFVVSPENRSVFLTVDPGLYTGAELVAALNARALVAAVHPTTGTNVTISFSLDETGRVAIKVSTPSASRRVVIYQAGKNYNKSIPYRLGFSRTQTVRTNLQGGGVNGAIPNLIRNTFDSAAPTPIAEYLDPRVGSTTEPNSYIEESPFAGGHDPPRLPYEVWNTIDSTQNGPLATHPVVGANILFEAHPFVVLRSSLVNDFTKTLLEEDDGHPSGRCSTTQDSVLCKVNIDRNLYSWIHYESHINQAMVHQLSGKPLSSFWVELADSNGEAFNGLEFKDYQLILKFETADPHAARNEAVVKAYVEQLFLEKVRCV
jgi:hypothetical protein